MKYGTKEISELTDLEVLQAHDQCLKSEKDRALASQHEKFQKSSSKYIGDFPSVNPAFTQLKNELKSEIDKRNIGIW